MMRALSLGIYRWYALIAKALKSWFATLIETP